MTLEMLEQVRKRLRGFVYLIEKHKRAVIYTDFADELREGALVAFEEFGPLDSFEKFKAKARFFLRQREDHIAVHQQPAHPDGFGRAGAHAAREWHRQRG